MRQIFYFDVQNDNVNSNSSSNNVRIVNILFKHNIIAIFCKITVILCEKYEDTYLTNSRNKPTFV